MDFTRLNLRPYRLNEGVATGNNAIEGEAKASAGAIDVSNPRQMDPRRKEMQMKQRTAKFGSPTTQQNVMSSFDILLQQKQAVKMFENQKADWRKELLEAANPDDDPNHPFVEIMPSTEFKAREAEQNVKKGVVKDKMAGAAPGRSGLDEELLVEDELQEGKKGKDKKNYVQKKASPKVKKAARELDNITKKSHRLAAKAKNNYKMTKKYAKQGDTKKANYHNTEGDKLANQAKKLRASGMKYVPLGSTTYSGSGGTRMNAKFRRDLKSSKGRENIVSRAVQEGKGGLPDDLDRLIADVRGVEDKRTKASRKKISKNPPRNPAKQQNVTFAHHEEVDLFNEVAPAIAAVAGKAAGALAGKGVAKATAGAAAKGGIRKFAARKATEYATDKATDTVTSLLSPNDQEYNESLTFDDVWNMIEARAAYADPAPVKHKKDTGKAISKGKYKGAVKNKDNTASPKENVARRTFNRNPQMKGDLQDKVKQSVLVDN